MNDGTEALQALMKRVRSSMNDEFGEIERGCKAASAFINAEQDKAAFEANVAASAAETDDEALRAELRRRVAAFVDADQAGAPDDELRSIATGEAAR